MNTKLYILLLLFFSITACNDWLDVELDNKVDDTKLFQSTEGFKEALAGIYSEMSKEDMYGEALSMEYLDLLAGYYSYSGVGNSYEYLKDYNYINNSSKNTIASFWSRLYSNIAQANCILEWCDKNGGVMTTDERNQVRGEALALRAYLHFDLYRLFSPDVKRSPDADGIPYNKEYGVSIPPMYSAKEALQLVINDLLEAEELLANDPITTVTPYAIQSSVNNQKVIDQAAKNAADQYVARINLYAVKAMLARAYQARGEYSKAASKAQEVIDSQKFRLLDFGSIDQSSAMVDLIFSDELIFGLRNSNLSSYSQRLHHDNVSGNITTLTPLPFSNITAVYESNTDDVRYAKWFNSGRMTKFLPDSSSIFPQKMPMIKLSEMYLLIAECSYDSDVNKALKYINELRNHRIRNNMPWTYLTKEYIYEEMKREFVGEGQLWYVYKRNWRTLPGNEVTGGVAPSDEVYVFPLPDAEIENGFRD